MIFSRQCLEIKGYHTAGGVGGKSLTPEKCVSSEFPNVSFNSLVTAELKGKVDFSFSLFLVVKIFSLSKIRILVSGCQSKSLD